MYRTENEARQAYDSMLDEAYGNFNIGPCEFSASEILKKLDEIAYNVGFDDFLDSENINIDELN